jgi:TolB-like protein/Flp pilus assembly protein TadD
VNDGPRDGEGSIWNQLRRRKVVQWGIAYAAGAWGLLQGLQFLAGTFGWTSRLLQLGTVAALVGLPIVLVLAWFHGERGEQRVSRVELAIVTLLFVLGGGLFWRFQHATMPVTTAAITTGADVSSGAEMATDSRLSIAVLPFENRSSSQDQAFFVDGIHDDILTQLSKVSALKVISRTSVERFRDTDVPIREIARQLGVANILEGGVQRAGDRVRINVQLIDAASDAHVWAETYDRDLTTTDIFAIQSELAAAIAGALRATLTREERGRIDAVPTRSLAAWEAYQLGRQRVARRDSASLDEAEKHFRRAIELDPGFALAHVGLADALTLAIAYSGRPFDSGLAAADAAASKALALDPGLAEAWASKGGIASSRRDYVQAEELLRKAIELNPNYATAHHWLSSALMESGHPQQAIAPAERAVLLDPLSVILQLNLGFAYEVVGRFDDAAARYATAVQLDPGYAVAYGNLAQVNALARNRYVDAVASQQMAVELNPGSPLSHAVLAWLWLDLGEDTRAQEIMDIVLQRWPDSWVSHRLAAIVGDTLGEHAEAERHAAKVLSFDNHDVAALRFLAIGDLRRGTPARARDRYASAMPELFDPAGPRVDTSNANAAVMLAAVLQRTGDTERASGLLDAAEKIVAEMPRLGVGGFATLDASILALRGDQARALAALREAQQAGWRSGWRHVRDNDPTLDSIRGQHEFRAIFADIGRDMARQRAELARRAGARLRQVRSLHAAATSLVGETAAR